MHVGKMVRQLVEGCSSVVHVARLAAVVKVVEGIIGGGRLSPATIGRNLEGTARPKHSIKCVDRLLGSPHMVKDRLFIFLAVAHHLLRGCARPVILVDWTHSGGTHEALVAAVPIGGRALPIYVEVYPLKKLGNAAVEKRFLCTLKAILPSECRSIIVSDAGFKGPFFQAVREFGWDFLGRVRGTAKATSSDGRTISKEEFYQRASISPTDLGTFGLFVKQHIPCRLVLVRKRQSPAAGRPHQNAKKRGSSASQHSIHGSWRRHSQTAMPRTSSACTQSACRSKRPFATPRITGSAGLWATCSSRLRNEWPRYSSWLPWPWRSSLSWEWAPNAVVFTAPIRPTRRGNAHSPSSSWPAPSYAEATSNISHWKTSPSPWPSFPE
jgi:hypothetical protein